MENPSELSEIAAYTGEVYNDIVPCFLSVASAYLRRFAVAQHDMTDGELMPADTRWTRATRRLWRKLSERDRIALLREKCEDMNAQERNRRFLRMCYLLTAEAGENGKFHMIIPPEIPEKGTEDNEQNECATV